MGSDDTGEALCSLSGVTKDAQPIHRVYVNGFWMDETEVTNEQFTRFVQETGYTTTAERKPDPKDFPGADPKMLVPGSAVFTMPAADVPLIPHLIDML